MPTSWKLVGAIAAVLLAAVVLVVYVHQGAHQHLHIVGVATGRRGAHDSAERHHNGISAVLRIRECAAKGDVKPAD